MADDSQVVSDLKQACIDLSNTALAMFDAFEKHGLEAAWEDPFLIKQFMEDHERIRGFIQRQVNQRMLALGVSPERLLKMAKGGS